MKDSKKLTDFEKSISNPIMWRKIIYATLVESSQNFNRIPFAVLMVLYQEGRAMPACEIADRMRISANTVTQQLMRLVHEELIAQTGIKYAGGALKTHYIATKEGKRFLNERLVNIARRAYNDVNF